MGRLAVWPSGAAMQAPSLDQHPFAARFGVDDATIRRVLAAAMSRGADFADCYFETAAHHSLSLEDGLVHHASSVAQRGLGVRAVKGQQTGYAFTEDLSVDAMLRAAQTAAAIASGTTNHVEPQRIELRSTPAYYDPATSWGDVPVLDKLPLVESVEKMARGMDPAVQKVSVSWVDSDEHVLVATSEGIAYTDRRPMAGIRLLVTAVKDGESQTGSHSLYRRADLSYFTPERLETMCRECIDRTMLLFDARTPPAGEMPVVLAAGASGILLHEAIGHGLEADFNRKGVSIYADMVGRKVAPDFVTVVDDGTIDGERGALNVDDEGNETERTVLIEDGVLRGYLHDRISAAQYGVAPTGSGRRQSFRHVPMPRMRCTYMENGTHSYDEMIASIDRGIVCETFTNGQVNIGAGDFTFFVKNGWMVEQGKITHPIRNVNIIGNGPEALRDITMAADDAKLDSGGWTCGKNGQGVPVSQGIPSVLVSRLVVGGEGA